METWGLSASDSHLLPRTSSEAALKRKGLQKFLQDTLSQTWSWRMKGYSGTLGPPWPNCEGCSATLSPLGEHKVQTPPDSPSLGSGQWTVDRATGAFHLVSFYFLFCTNLGKTRPGPGIWALTELGLWSATWGVFVTVGPV